MRPLAAGRPLVEAVGGPLIYALEEPDRKAIIVGFDLFKTDFPLRVAFPLILSNTLRWLHPAALDQSSLQLAAGPADPAAGRPRRHLGHRHHAERSGGEGAGHARRGELHRDRRGRPLHAGDRARRPARGRQPHGRRRVEPRAAAAAGAGRPVGGGDGAGADPARAVAALRRCSPWCCWRSRGCCTGGGRAAGAWRRRSGRGDRWALALRGALVVVLALTLLRPDAAALGRPPERRVPARPLRQREPGRARAGVPLRGRRRRRP